MIPIQIKLAALIVFVICAFLILGPKWFFVGVFIALLVGVSGRNSGHDGEYFCIECNRWEKHPHTF